MKTDYEKLGAHLYETARGPRKSDTAIGEVALAWVPWRSGAEGIVAPAC